MKINQRVYPDYLVGQLGLANKWLVSVSRASHWALLQLTGFVKRKVNRILRQVRNLQLFFRVVDCVAKTLSPFFTYSLLTAELQWKFNLILIDVAIKQWCVLNETFEKRITHPSLGIYSRICILSYTLKIWRRDVCQIKEEDRRRSCNCSSNWCAYTTLHQQGIHHICRGRLRGRLRFWWQ